MYLSINIIIMIIHYNDVILTRCNIFINNFFTFIFQLMHIRQINMNIDDSLDFHSNSFHLFDSINNNQFHLFVSNCRCHIKLQCHSPLHDYHIEYHSSSSYILHLHSLRLILILILILILKLILILILTHIISSQIKLK